MIIEIKDEEGAAVLEVNTRCQRCQITVKITVKIGGEVTPLLQCKTETSKRERHKIRDWRREEKKKTGCDWWEGACWDEWLYLEKPDAA